ncbi:MAG: hypothetical protein AB7O96_13505, partial [Pseudobdellovibrionaceae bacterium]
NAETIDGSTSFSLATQYQFLTIVSDGTSWNVIGTNAGSSGGMQLISTQVANNSASLEWTGLSGIYFILKCTQLVAGTNAVYPILQFGSGAGPTWVTSNYWNYNNNNAQVLSTSIDLLGPSSSSNPTNNSMSSSAPSSQSADLTVDINLSSSMVSSKRAGTAYYNAAGGIIVPPNPVGFNQGNTGIYNSFMIKMTSGNIASGTCSLYKMSQ